MRIKKWDKMNVILRITHILFANSPGKAVYPGTFTDSRGQTLNGANNYVIHSDKGQTPPVNAFWSLTMYNNTSYLADNPDNV